MSRPLYFFGTDWTCRLAQQCWGVALGLILSTLWSLHQSSLPVDPVTVDTGQVDMMVIELN